MKNKNYFLLSMFLLLCIIPPVYADEELTHGPEIVEDWYSISRSKVEREISEGILFKDIMYFNNFGEGDLQISFSISGELTDIIEFDFPGILLEGRTISEVNFLVKGKKIGNYTGYISIRGDIDVDIPVNVSVVDFALNPRILIEIEPLERRFDVNKFLEFKVNLNKIISEEVKNVTLTYNLIDNSNNSYFLDSETIDVENSFQQIKKFKLFEELEEGEYILEATLEQDNKIITTRTPILLKTPFFSILLFGFLPIWAITIFLGVIIVGLLTFYLIKKKIESGKKYRMKLNAKKIPKKNPEFLFLGKVAETKLPAYLEPDRMMTHTIVAGATGGGKSISAQVIVEEALLKNVAVIVFDPTAQWSGMLRKCTDKKMIAYYPKFGLKESDAKAFMGNIRQVKNAREFIDIKKFVNPGQIQIFTLNKLDPNDIDLFVANVIRQIFRSDPKEAPNLKILLVFDEVHRLLAKFGGSGEGFLQIERAAREFRKWGMGIMLISQVLSDFIGEIKANISTEVQMRTRDEGDLNRIKTKYGEEFLQSLVKASVGVGMFVNPAYNAANPYFINFRPILHNTRRLSDEELEKYNKYNDLVDDLESQIEQLEELKIDVFDLKMELKLVKDKVMTGNFAIVDIYLEGLKPRVEKQWKKIGKKPKKRELQLVDEEEIKKSIEEAKKSREAWEKKQGKEKEKSKVKKEIKKKTKKKGKKKK